LRRAREISSGDNEMTRLDRAPFFLTMPRVLQSLGISPDSDRVEFEVRTVAGETARFAAPAGMPPGRCGPAPARSAAPRLRRPARLTPAPGPAYPRLFATARYCPGRGAAR